MSPIKRSAVPVLIVRIVDVCACGLGPPTRPIPLSILTCQLSIASSPRRDEFGEEEDPPSFPLPRGNLHRACHERRNETALGKQKNPAGLPEKGTHNLVLQPVTRRF